MSRFGSFYHSRGKRALDLTLSLFILILASPLLISTAVAVLATLGRPVFFRQQRPGLHGKPFRILKFRTMAESRDANGELLADHERLHPMGRILRTLSLDELPELVNVLRGEMSLVGPRPLLMSYIELYSPEQMRRHDAVPGVTGWAQVNGRNAVSWQEKLALDVWYVDHLSLSLDIRILFKTLVLVVTGRGISAPGHATMPQFRGDDS